MSVERHTLEAEVSHCALICDGSVATICGTPLYASLFPTTQMRYQSFRPRATGRMEFSVRLVLNSSSVYYKSRVSFFHNANAYWQTLLSAGRQSSRRRCLDLATDIIEVSGLGVVCTRCDVVLPYSGCRTGTKNTISDSCTTRLPKRRKRSHIRNE